MRRHSSVLSSSTGGHDGMMQTSEWALLSCFWPARRRQHEADIFGGATASDPSYTVSRFDLRGNRRRKTKPCRRRPAQQH